MLAFGIRRAIWALPTLFGVSLVVFLLTTLLPDPAAEIPRDASPAARTQTEELRRARFLDLPRFLNVTPEDVRTRVDACVAHVVADDVDAAYCEARLATIGGAALPHLLPRFDNLPPGPRGRLALALAPVARRMGGFDERDLATPERAALFWTRFWEDRSVDFTEPAARREVDRLVRRGAPLVERELRVSDTFILPHVVATMRTTTDGEALVRLTRLASHVTQRNGVITPEMDVAHARGVAADWQSWWFVHETDYVALQGGAKVTASIAQTRYAKWVFGAVTGQLGLSTRDGVPIFDKLLARAPVTIGMALLGLLVAACLAVPAGVLAALRRGDAIDFVVVFTATAVYAVPTFLVAMLLAPLSRGGHPVVTPVLAMATVSLSVMTLQQRASTLEALSRDYVRVARAKGARTLRVAIVHALRNALLPTVTLAGVQFPSLLGAAFVVEEVFDVHGVGWETLRAIEARDVGWIIAATLLCACVTTFCLVVSDVVCGALDPRVRERQGTRRTA